MQALAPFIWNQESGDYYTNQWNQELGQWERVWLLHPKEVIPNSSLLDVPPEAEPGLDVVNAGVSYQELDAQQEAALEAHLSRRQVQRALESVDATVVQSLAGPEETIYQPLHDSMDMRVLELYPGNIEDELRCRLHVCSVESMYPDLFDQRTKILYRSRQCHAISHTSGRPVWYTALSYVWGDTTRAKSIICNTLSFKITLNLDIALRHLRQSDVAIMLWIDQICINQQDLKEKSQQVRLMSNIYLHAWSTLVWLGEEADNSQGALETIRAVNSAFQYQCYGWAPDLESLERLSLPMPGSVQWSELNKFLSRPWFQRVWVIQEVVLSARIQVVCGQHTITWTELGMFAEHMDTHDLSQYLSLKDVRERRLRESGCLRIKDIDHIKGAYQNNPPTLISALVEARSAQATDVRDKVFAIMGMTSTLIDPDYSKAIVDVYTEAASRTQTYLMSLLCCVDHAQPGGDLPSWVPNWAVPRRTVSLGYMGENHAVYKTTRGQELDAHIDQSERSLTITGILTDTISIIGELAELSLKDVVNEGTQTNHVVMQSMQQATMNCQPYPSNSGLFNAFWQTLVAGKDHTGKLSAPSEYEPIFALLIDTASATSPSLPDQPHFKRRLTLENLTTRRPSHTYREMQISFQAAVNGRRFGTTSNRYMGLFPQGTKAGDNVCVFLGGHIPFVIRQQEAHGSYQLIGECYVHGIMAGEVEHMGGLEAQKIKLI